MTIGLLGKKIGMTQVFLEDGRVEAVTAVEAGPCMVTQVRTKANDGYEAVQLGFGEVRRITKAMEGHLRPTGKFRHLRELPVRDIGEVQLGQRVDASILQPGDLVDVTGTSKGRGFAGGVRRHGFHGGPKTHGQSDRHRAPGSIGAGTTPGRVLKGKKMAGHMGNSRTTVQGLEIIQVDPERNLLLIKGAVPGARNGLLIIRWSTKSSRPMERVVSIAESPAPPAPADEAAVESEAALPIDEATETTAEAEAPATPTDEEPETPPKGQKG